MGDKKKETARRFNQARGDLMDTTWSICGEALRRLRPRRLLLTGSYHDHDHSLHRLSQTVSPRRTRKLVNPTLQITSLPGPNHVYQRADSAESAFLDLLQTDSGALTFVLVVALDADN